MTLKLIAIPLSFKVIKKVSKVDLQIVFKPAQGKT